MCASDFIATENGFKKEVLLERQTDESEEQLKKQKLAEIKSLKKHSLLMEQLKRERIHFSLVFLII